MRTISYSFLGLVALFATRVDAATIIVHAGDQLPNGTCSLANAIEAANTNFSVGGCPAGSPGEDTIRFDPTLTSITFSQPISGTVDALRVTEALVIDGSDAGGVLLQRSTALDDSTPFRLIQVFTPTQPVTQGPALRLVAIRFANGLTTGFSGDTSNGGCLLIHGSLSMQGVSFTGCRANGLTGSGGAVAQIGNGDHTLPTLHVAGCTFEANEIYAGSGGALYAESPDVDVIDSTFRNNLAGSGGVIGQGGGLSVHGDVAGMGTRIERSTFSGNRAMQGGGGLLVPAPALLRNITVSNNSTSVGSGGGILLDGAETDGLPGHPADITIENSTIADNSAGDGAGVTGGAFAGGIYYAAPSTQSGAFPLQLDSVLLAGNTARYNDEITPRDIGAQFTIGIAGTNNLSRALGTGGSNSNVYFDFAPATCEPQLAPLTANGGPTATRALLPGSCAIDAGANPDGLTTDQRGSGYPRVLGSAADIGAFEGSSDVIFADGFD
ncbi:MAG: right-handed parallel beta-helix repeat-containing protein [Dokdonella sp.]|nr:right-handed parallel beta-helix repeat-containing protein [Dokdonella sp.]